MSTTTTTLHCGTNPLYAHLYSSKNFLSPSFYLPDPIVPLPISSRPTDKELAEFFKRGRGDGRGSRWTKAGSRGGQREEEGEEESMLPAVMSNPSQQEQKQKQHEAKEDKVVTVEQNLLPVLSGQDLQDEEVGKASWAYALLSYLSQRSTGHRASPPARLQAFRCALDECEKSVGMDLIKLSWRFSLPRSVAATFAARTHGDDGGDGDDNAERMDEDEMIRVVEGMLERDQGIITMTTLHQCGLSFLLRIALPIASASASAASGNAQLPFEEQLLQHIHRARLSASASLMIVHSSSSSLGTDGLQWLLLEQAADWVRLDEALRKGVLNKEKDLPRLFENLHDTLHETVSHLTLPPALEKKLLSLQSSARNRRTSSASSSASHTSSEGEEEEEQRRGREAALAIPSASTNATGASEHRSDSAVAGLGFSPRDERKPLCAPQPSSLDADASVATIKGRSGLGSRVELAGGRAEMEGGIIRDCLYDARRDRLVLARLPELQLV